MKSVAEVYLASQVANLLSDGIFRKVGSSEEEKSRVRLIVASNRDLDQLIQTNEFLHDLYDRINFFQIRIPDLDHSPEQIESLVQQYLETANREYQLNKSLTREALHCFRHYRWPGNLRELNYRVRYWRFRQNKTSLKSKMS